MKGFRVYDKSELFSLIDKISIEKSGKQVITKLGSKVIKVANVSDRYEIFDITKYLKEKIELIESNFTISKYSFTVKGGQQYLQLISDSVEIGGQQFYKSFYILNSSDKSRRLSFHAGLHSDKFYLIGGNNIGLSRKHLRGVTEAADIATDGLNGETFDEQVESISILLNHKISLSKIREVILGDGDIPAINHRKFDAFKNLIRWSSDDGNLILSDIQRNQLYIPSDKMDVIENDFYMDAFLVFCTYMRLFNRQDSHVIKNETIRIMNMTQWAVRNSVLESLGI
jgi:hypothetical protein